MANTFPNSRAPSMNVMFDNTKASGSVKTWRTLIIGTKNDDAPAVINKPYMVINSDQGVNLFGSGSVLSEQISTYKKNDSNIETWAIALEKSKDKMASIELKPKIKSLVKDETISGIVSLYIGNKKLSLTLNKVKDLKSFCDSIVSQINEDKTLLFNASNGKLNDKIILQMQQGGDFLNGIIVTFNLNGETFPDGIISVDTGVFVDPTPPPEVKPNDPKVKALVDLNDGPVSVIKNYFDGGQGNPDVSVVFTSIKDMRFNTFVSPFSDKQNFQAMATELQERWEPTKQNDGVCFLSISTDVATSCESVKDYNSQNITMPNTYGLQAPSYIVNAAIAAQCSASAFADPAMPLAPIQLEGIEAPEEFKRLDFEERTRLLDAGISTLDYVGTNVTTNRMLTTYKKNDANIPDTSYLKLETIYTLSFIRQYFREMFKKKFPRAKLMDDTAKLPPGQVIVTPKSAKAELIVIYQDLIDLGYCSDMQSFIANTIVARDIQNTEQLNILLSPKLMSQLYNINVTVQFRS